jgi:hypothetical protein
MTTLLTYDETLHQIRTLTNEDVEPNAVARGLALQFLVGMQLHNLECVRVVSLYDGGYGFIWAGCHNTSYYAHIECVNDGVVTGLAYDHNDHDYRNMKFWWVKEFVMESGESEYTIPGDKELVLTLAETLEFIRHWMWANHNG